ncbi:MAG: glycosyltransferase family 4 protein [Proteobacteria bacterium]|nr:glycosyltransferase family 1 protein [Pseudomonadota bacterium]NOG59090.1 glycosyltransferase family 4 protein [Pseudomonadota bacterium]
MRIAIYWEQDEWGGVDTHLLTLLQTWPNPNDEFVLFYNKGNSGLVRIQESLHQFENVELFEVISYSYNEVISRVSSILKSRWQRAPLYFFQPLLYLFMISRLSKAFRKAEQFDLLFSNNGAYPAAWGCQSAIRAGAKVGIKKRVLMVHHEATKSRKFMGWFERLVDNMIIRDASAIICPSRATKKTLLQRRAFTEENIPIHVIHNGVGQSEDFDKGIIIRERLKSNTGLLVGIVGRIQSYKGHEDLILALSRLSEEHRKIIHLVVIGKGEESEIDRLKALSDSLDISEQISFLGYIPGDSKALIKQLDLLVVATRSFEGFGLTLAEAMIVKTPVLATRVGAIPEFVDDSVGTLVNPSSPKDLALALTDFVENREKWFERCELAQKRIDTISSNMAKNYQELFKAMH